MPRSLALAVVLAACGGGPRPATTPAVATPSAGASTAAAPTVPACASPEHRQLDFWIGDWDLVVTTRTKPGVDEWTTAPGTQHVEAILGGCAIAEHFTGEGWAGASYSMWQPKLATWRQAWVDDSGSFLVFTGGPEAGAFTLYGEPFTNPADGKKIQMRMTFVDITADTLRWRWQRSADGGPYTDSMIIEYKRRP